MVSYCKCPAHIPSHAKIVASIQGAEVVHNVGFDRRNQAPLVRRQTDAGWLIARLDSIGNASSLKTDAYSASWTCVPTTPIEVGTRTSVAP